MVPVDLIRLILRTAGINGVGQTPNSEDNNDVLTHLNVMLAEWSAQRWLVYHLVDVSVTSTGATSYTVGTGGNFNVTRPDRIEAAYWRSTAVTPNVDYPLVEIPAREDWNRIAVKNVGNWPGWFFYDSGYPLGTFYPYPVPSGQPGELHINVKETLSSFPDLVTAINLPPAYLNALLWNGAQRARILYGLEADRSVDGQARKALAVIRGSNVQLPSMRMPAVIAGAGRRFNLWNGTVG